MTQSSHSEITYLYGILSSNHARETQIGGAVLNVRIAVCSIALFVWLGAHADDGNVKTAQPASKETMDQIAQFNRAIVHLRSLGINWLDIEPINLGFESESFSGCASKSEKLANGKDEWAIGLISCQLRHPLTKPDEK